MLFYPVLDSEWDFVILSCLDSEWDYVILSCLGSEWDYVILSCFRFRMGLCYFILF